MLLGDLLGRTLGHASTWVASGVLAAALVAVAVATKETLPLDNRKPFTLATANPFSNIWLLFSNGPGLRGLTLSTACFFTAQSTWSIVFPWRFGVLGWTPEQNSAYKLWLQPPAIAVDQFFVAPFMRWAGNLRCFEWSCLATAVGYYLCKKPHDHCQHLGCILVIWVAFFSRSDASDMSMSMCADRGAVLPPDWGADVAAHPAVRSDPGDPARP